MSWVSGQDLMDKCIVSISSIVIDDQERKAVYHGMIHAFEQHGCDCLEGCMGSDIAFDEAMSEIKQINTLASTQ